MAFTFTDINLFANLNFNKLGLTISCKILERERERERRTWRN